MDDSIGMLSKHLLPIPIPPQQSPYSMPSALLLVLLAQLEVQILRFRVIVNDKLRDRRDATHILLWVQRRRSYDDFIHISIHLSHKHYMAFLRILGTFTFLAEFKHKARIMKYPIPLPDR